MSGSVKAANFIPLSSNKDIHLLNAGSESTPNKTIVLWSLTHSETYGSPPNADMKSATAWLA
jgi:hypothetical protein